MGDLKRIWIIPVLVSILVLGTLGLSLDALAYDVCSDDGRCAHETMTRYGVEVYNDNTDTDITDTQLELLEELSREKIILLLEKAETPEGYERKMVIVKNQLYGYREYDRNYMGSVIKEKRIFPLTEEVPDGPYFADKLVPRMLFSFNNVVLTELLKKVDDNENNNGKKKSTKSKK